LTTDTEQIAPKDSQCKRSDQLTKATLPHVGVTNCPNIRYSWSYIVF